MSANRTRFGLTLAAVAAFALVMLVPASARPDARYGGVLVVGLSGGDPATLDPTVSRGGSETLYPVFCQRLYDLNSKFQLVPVLAAAVPVLSSDKLSYAIKLREGVQFNDGTPFNAQAVVTTVQRFMTYPGSSRTADYTSVDSVSASGPYTVVFHLKGRDSTFVGNPWVLSPTQLTKLGADFATNPVCVGPFMFDHRIVGDNITMIKSPYYYDQKDVYLDKIVFKPMPDAAAATAALEAGDVQVLDQISTTELPAVRQSSSVRTIQADRVGWWGVQINIGNRNGVGSLPYANVGTPLASSPKLRQAFEEAIDRDALNKVVFDGLVQPSCTPVPPADTAWYQATRVPCTPYNPADARKLVAASGFPSPTVHLLTANTTDQIRLAQFIQAQEAAVGINVAIDAPDLATSLARAQSGSIDARVGGLVPGGPDPQTNIFQFVASSGARNYSGYSNPRLDLILSNGLRATDLRARSTLYHVAQQIIAADRPLIVLYNPVVFAASSTSVTGVKLSSTGTTLVANARLT